MDFDYWSSRVSPPKFLSAVHPGFVRPDNRRSAMDDSEGDDDGRAYFLCPFCYVDIELPLICSHLNEEHCFDFKNSVCPLCASHPGKDVIGHFTTHHANSLKLEDSDGGEELTGEKGRDPSKVSPSKVPPSKRKRPEKSAALTMITKKMQSNRRGNKSGASPDPLLSSFICSIPKEIPKEDDCRSSGTDVFESIEASTEVENSEENAEKIRRADFVRQLLLSTISWSLPESQHF